MSPKFRFDPDLERTRPTSPGAGGVQRAVGDGREVDCRSGTRRRRACRSCSWLHESYRTARDRCVDSMTCSSTSRADFSFDAECRFSTTWTIFQLRWPATSASGPWGTITHGYDAAGNRLNLALGSTTSYYVYGAYNKLCASSTSSTTTCSSGGSCWSWCATCSAARPAVPSWPVADKRCPRLGQKEARRRGDPGTVAD